MLKYLMLNLKGNNIDDVAGVEIGESIGKMIELGYLELYLRVIYQKIKVEQKLEMD